MILKVITGRKTQCVYACTNTHTLWDRSRGRVKEISHLQVLAENAHSNLDSVGWKSVGWTASACEWQGLGTAPWFAAFKKNLLCGSWNLKAPGTHT